MPLVQTTGGRFINVPDTIGGGVQTVPGRDVPAGGFIGTGFTGQGGVAGGQLTTGGGSLQTGGVAGGIGAVIPGQNQQLAQNQTGGLANRIAEFQTSLNTPQGRAAFEAIATPEQIQQAQQAMAQGGFGVGAPQLPATGAPVAPPTGLIGGEQALQQGLGASVAALEQGFGQAGGAIGRGTSQALGLVGQGGQAVQGGTAQALGLIRQAQEPLQPFAQGGTQAQQLQLAQSGALGPEAQQAAFAAFAESPGQRFLQQEGERALTRNAAALGGIGGGNVRRALVQQGVGLAQQDFGNQFQRLGQLSGQGLTAAGGIAQLGGQGAGFAQQAGLAQGQLLGQGAGIAQQGGLAQGGLLAQGSLAGANIFQQAGRDIATQRFQTGRDIANAVEGTTSALSTLAQQQGTGLADITGGGAVNIANLLSGAGQQDAASQQALATILANLATQQGTQQAILQQGIGEAASQGITGQAAGLRAGVERVAGAFE